jgi:CRISPR-associated protein Cmr5
MSQQILAQRRAAHALGCIERHKRAGKGTYGNYVSYVEALPATILMNGLGQACATLLSKAEGDKQKPHGLLFGDVESWLCGEDPAAPFKGDLLEAITEKDQATYLRAQAEALQYLIWLKKFASAYLERGGDV